MRKLQQRLTPSDRLKWLFFLLLGLFSGMVWALLAQLIDTQSLHQMLYSLGSASLWLTVLFLGLLVLTLSLFTHSLFVGNAVVGIAAVILSFVNYFKMKITMTPLSIGDFTLIGQLGNIATINKSAITFGRNSILAIFAAVIWLLLMWFFSRPLRIRWRWSALGGLISGAVLMAVFWFGANPLVYVPLQCDIGIAVYQADANQSCGVLLGLWRALIRQATQTAGVDSPAYMDQVVEQTQAYVGASSEPSGGENPNIIFILSESFFDVTELEGVTFDADPLADFHALQKESVSGTFYTRSLGYGTCNIELEIMTGINTALLSGEDLYSFSPDVFSRLPSVPSLLRDNGYYTAMLHMFNDSVYHRTEFFNQLGFDNLFFTGDFAEFYTPAAEAPDYWTYMADYISGAFYSDDFMTDLLITLYDYRKTQSDQPVFLYGISMENHSTYTGKYPEEQLSVGPHSPLTGEAADNLLNVSQGISNASAALGRLVDYFRTVPEPTVIVFYGDHRPGLGLDGGGSVYSELGIVPADTAAWSLEDYENLYATDYLIWSNDPSYLPAAPGSIRDASSNYLGVQLLDMARVEKPLYWRLLSQLSQFRCQDTMVYHRGTDGTLTARLPQDGEAGQGLSLLSDLLKDSIYGERYATEKISGIAH